MQEHGFRAFRIQEDTELTEEADAASALKDRNADLDGKPLDGESPRVKKSDATKVLYMHTIGGPLLHLVGYEG